MRERWKIAAALVAAILMAACTGCGGGGGHAGGTSGGAPQPVTVGVSPAASSLPPGGTQTFAATVANTAATGVTWSVQEGAAGGAITPAGDYTAPGQAGTYHVVATSQADPTKSAAATVTVHVVVSVTPAALTLTLGQQQTFTASVAGTSNQAVTWTIQEGAVGGTVDSGGHYVAPGKPGTYHLVAASQLDPAQTATVVITVQAGSATGTIQ